MRRLTDTEIRGTTSIVLRHMLENPHLTVVDTDLHTPHTWQLAQYPVTRQFGDTPTASVDLGLEKVFRGPFVSKRAYLHRHPQ